METKLRVQLLRVARFQSVLTTELQPVTAVNPLGHAPKGKHFAVTSQVVCAFNFCHVTAYALKQSSFISWFRVLPPS